jgi:hypothetical protein
VARGPQSLFFLRVFLEDDNTRPIAAVFAGPKG